MSKNEMQNYKTPAIYYENSSDFGFGEDFLDITLNHDLWKKKSIKSFKPKKQKQELLLCISHC